MNTYMCWTTYIVTIILGLHTQHVYPTLVLSIPVSLTTSRPSLPVGVPLCEGHYSSSLRTVWVWSWHLWKGPRVQWTGQRQARSSSSVLESIVVWPQWNWPTMEMNTTFKGKQRLLYTCKLQTDNSSSLYTRIYNYSTVSNSVYMYK